MYQHIKCPVCGTSLEVTSVAQIDYCPVKGCGVYIKDKLHINFIGSGLNESEVPDYN